jgi:putative sigma-54 modulation protein
MKVQFREGKVSKVLRAHVEGRLGLALGRFADRIERVIVRVSELEGEKRCRIEVGLRPKMIRVEGLDASAQSAADHAISRVGASVGRAIEREQILGAGDWQAPKTPTRP